MLSDGGIRKNNSMIFHSASKRLIDDVGNLIYDIWKIKKPTKSYQQGKFSSYQLNLNIRESQLVINELPASHNLVLRGF